MVYKKRLFDIFLSLIIFIILLVPMIGIGVLVRLSSRGPALHWSSRVGKDNKIFRMPKFRSMHITAPNIASHLLKDPNLFLTPMGKFMRKSSIDELPQLWTILIGEMSFVGPRPALYNQEDLIQMRTKNNVHTLVPGLTGWAQVNGRDNLSISEKVKLDTEYLNNQSFLFDLKIIFLTFVRVFKQQEISH